MTNAETFLQAWHSTTTTLSVKQVAIQTDPQVEINRRKAPYGVDLYFSDGSEIETFGKGNSFTIKVKLP